MSPWKYVEPDDYVPPEDEPLLSLTEYNDGFTAGWRGDELVVPKSYSYNMGYEAGAAAKESVG